MADSYQLLNNFPSNEACEEFVHKIVDLACGREGPGYASFSKALSLEEFCRLRNASADFVKDCIRSGLDSAAVVSQLRAGGVSEDKASVVAECLSGRPSVQDFFRDRSATISYQSLLDFEWDLQVAFSSDKLSDVQEPLVSLKFHLAGPGQDSSRGGGSPCCVEMSRAELAALISSLEGCNKVVQSLSPAL